MAKCRFCSKDIQWIQMNGKWHPMDENGKPHRCQANTQITNLRNMVCTKCWRPIVGTRSQCNCISPVPVSKHEAMVLHANFLKGEKEKARALHTAHTKKRKIQFLNPNFLFRILVTNNVLVEYLWMEINCGLIQVLACMVPPYI